MFGNVREMKLSRERDREHAHREITESRSFNIDCIYENIITHVMLKSLKMEMNGYSLLFCEK